MLKELLTRIFTWYSNLDKLLGQVQNVGVN